MPIQQEQPSLGRKISELPHRTSTDLDYEVFPLMDTRFHSSDNEPIQRTLMNRPIDKIACAPTDGSVWAATGSRGLIKGIMMKMPHFSKMATSQTFQEMWAVKLDKEIKLGDCGSWVMDPDGNIYGHIGTLSFAINPQSCYKRVFWIFCSHKLRDLTLLMFLIYITEPYLQYVWAR